MSDIRFNRWLHQSGTGGIYQDSSGNIGIGTSVPTSALDIQSGSIKIGGNVLSSSGVSTFTNVVSAGINVTGVVTATSFEGDGSNLTGIDATQIQTGNTSVQTVDTGSDGHVKVTTEGTERLRISANGNITHTYSDSSTTTSTQNPPGIRIYNTDNTLGRLAGIHFSHGAAGSANAGIFHVTTDTDTTSAGCLGDLAFYMKADASSTMTERMRLDSSGRLMVGTTDSSGTQLIKVNGTTGGSLNGGAISLTQGRTTPPNGSTHGVINFGTETRPDGGAQIVSFADGAWTDGSDHNSGLYFATTANGATSPTERMRLDSSGRLLINTISAVDSTHQLQVGARSGPVRTTTLGIYGYQTNQSSESIISQIILNGGTDSGSGGAKIALVKGTNNQQDTLRFYTGSTSLAERMRIDNGGRFLVGLTEGNIPYEYGLFGKPLAPTSNSTAFADQVTPLSVYGNFGGGSNSQASSSALTVYGWSSLATSPGVIMRGWWSTNGPSLGTPTLRYQIASNGNVTNTNGTYGALSDARYKQDVEDAASQWDDIKNIAIRKFRFIKDVESETSENPAPYLLGCIAQEVEQISPSLIEIQGDDTDEDGNIIENVKTLKYSVLYMKAVKALQEAMERIETLESRIDAAGL